jgi:hypothetical protein
MSSDLPFFLAVHSCVYVVRVFVFFFSPALSNPTKLHHYSARVYIRSSFISVHLAPNNRKEKKLRSHYKQHQSIMPSIHSILHTPQVHNLSAPMAALAIPPPPAPRRSIQGVSDGLPDHAPDFPSLGDFIGSGSGNMIRLAPRMNMWNASESNAGAS